MCATDHPTDHIGEVTQYCRHVLMEFIDISREMAAILAHQMRTQTDNPEAAQATVASFATLTQAARRTIMLHEKLGQPKKAPSQRAQARRVAARKKIIRDVEDAIENKAPAEERETLHAEFLERLDRPDLEEDIADRPAADIITDMCRDLGLSGLSDGHRAKRRIPHDIAILNARAEQLPGAGPSEKLLALLAAAPPRPAWPPAGPTDEEIAKMDMKTLMRRVGILREPLGG